jgi:hypothetical protein
MGIRIESYPVYNGAATLQNVYVNVRDFRTTKEVERGFNIETNENTSTDIYKFEFIVNYILNHKTINTNFISKQSEIPYTGNLWELAYTELKANLDAENLTYSDNI